MSFLIKRTDELAELRRNGGMLLFKGGGGGGGQREATPEEKRLWAAQAQSLESLNAVSMPSLVTGMNNLGVMANESMDGTLAARLRGIAGADAAQAAGMGLQATGRQLDRFGSTLNPNAMAAQAATAGLEGARMKSNAMNQATMGAEDVKWQRNAALTGLASGQGASAVSGMGSLAGQIGADRQASNTSAANQQAANSQALAGLGSMAAYMLKADGGEVKKPVRLADGGGLQKFQSVGMPQNKPWQFSPGRGSEGATGIGLADVAGAVAPSVAMHLAKPLVSAGLDSAAKFAGTQAGNLAASAGLNMTQAAAPVADAVITPVAQKAASTMATNAAAGGVMGTIGAAVPWIAGAYLLGSALDLFADGGDVGRKDMRPGGHVRGPGTETSDDIPALLSDNEFVNNADSVKLPRSQSEKVVKDWLDTGGSTKRLLNDLNNAGLAKRGKAPVPLKKNKRGEVMAASGGLAALGSIARGFVPTAMGLDAQKEQNRRFDVQDARIAETHQATMTDRAEAKKREADVMQVFKNAAEESRQYGEALQSITDGGADSGAAIAYLAPRLGKLMGKNVQPLQDGSYAIADGNGPQANFQRVSADDLAKMAMDPQLQAKLQLQHRRQVYEQAAAIDPRYAAAVDSAMNREMDALYKDRDFDYRAGRDKVGDVQWQKTFGQNVKNADRNYGLSAASHGLARQQYNDQGATRELNTTLARLGTGIIRDQQIISTSSDPAEVEAAKKRLAAGVTSLNAYKQTGNGGKGGDTVHSVVKGGDGNYVMMMTNGTSVDTGVKATGGLTYEKALGLAAKVSPYASPDELRANAEALMKPISAPGSNVPANFFSTPAELESAINSGKVKSGDSVMTPAGRIKIK